jgi:hypothetical protein
MPIACEKYLLSVEAFDKDKTLGRGQKQYNKYFS